MIDFNNVDSITEQDVKDFMENIVVPRMTELVAFEQTHPVTVAASLLSTTIMLNSFFASITLGTKPSQHQIIMFAFYMGMIAEREGWMLPRE